MRGNIAGRLAPASKRRSGLLAYLIHWFGAMRLRLLHEGPLQLIAAFKWRLLAGLFAKIDALYRWASAALCLFWDELKGGPNFLIWKGSAQSCSASRSRRYYLLRELTGRFRTLPDAL